LLHKKSWWGTSLGFGGFCVPCDLSSSPCLKSTSSGKTPCLSFSSIRINYVGDTTSKFPLGNEGKGRRRLPLMMIHNQFPTSFIILIINIGWISNLFANANPFVFNNYSILSVPYQRVGSNYIPNKCQANPCCFVQFLFWRIIASFHSCGHIVVAWASLGILNFEKSLHQVPLVPIQSLGHFSSCLWMSLQRGAPRVHIPHLRFLES
jgi:hypothetical protein